jgi:hypothetical protein
MKEVEKEIEDWIKPYVTVIGNQIEIDPNLRESNPTKYFVQITIPNRFEKYAIAPHSFWINYNVPDNEIRESRNDDPDMPEEDFTRISWKEFYNLKGVKFDLNDVILSTIYLRFPFKQLNNELYPGGGIVDKETLQSIAKIVLELYGDQKIEVFYIIMSTMSWDKDRMFTGRISELNVLFDNKELNFTPSLIYPKAGNWVINTDYDLSFSTIGGDTEFIDELVSRNTNEIFEVEY